MKKWGEGAFRLHSWRYYFIGWAHKIPFPRLLGTMVSKSTISLEHLFSEQMLCYCSVEWFRYPSSPILHLGEYPKSINDQ